MAEAQDGVPQLFSFLNRAVGDGSDAAAARRRSSGEDKSVRWAIVHMRVPICVRSGQAYWCLTDQCDEPTAAMP